MTITFPDRGPWYVHTDGSTDGWTEVTGLDDARTVTIDVPALGGGSFTLSDCGDPPAEIVVPVEGSN